MATINLGNIKFNWKGTYAGGTAYVVDDVVSYSGSSYICKLASTGNLPTNGTYWDVMSLAGTNGTDVGTTITTQGDILYRDGSGLQRLAAGTATQLLQTGGSGANPSWVDAPSGVVKKIEEYTNNTRTVLSNNSAAVNIFTGTFTTTVANSKTLIQVFMPGWGTAAGSINCGISWNGTSHDGTATYSYGSSDDTYLLMGQTIQDNSGTPGSHAWGVYYDSYSSSSARPLSIINPDNNDDGRIKQDVTSIVFTEFKN